MPRVECNNKNCFFIIKVEDNDDGYCGSDTVKIHHNDYSDNATCSNYINKYQANQIIKTLKAQKVIPKDA